MARRRISRGRSVRKVGRQGLWVRYATFTPSNIVTAPLLTENSMVPPLIWERNVSDTTNPKRGPGGPLLKRAFGSAMWEIRETSGVNTVRMPFFEVLIFAASETDPVASDAADFEFAMERQRVLHYSAKSVDVVQLLTGPSAVQQTFWCTLPFDIKVSARLSSQDIVMMTRCSETVTVDVAIDVRAQFSAYITTP